MKIDLRIKGIHCQSCKMLIEDALEDLGVESSNVNPEKGTAVIEFDQNKVTEEEIRKAIIDEGYQVE